MSKEIYKEYVNKYFFECATYEEKKTLNDGYIWNRGAVMTFSESNEDVGEVCDSFFMIDSSEYKFIARKPKTQMINGHEVVAPRYDDDYLTKNNIWVFNPLSIGGVANLIVKVNNLYGVENLGWFDNERNALAYAKAHRENKND